MAQRLFIPRLGHTMTEGIVTSWYVADGACVAVGDPIYDLEYDKATEQMQAEKAGVLRRLVEEGATVPVGDTVGVILEPGDDLETVLAQKVRKAFVPQTPNVPTAAHSMAHAGQEAPVAAVPAAAAPVAAAPACEPEKTYDAELLVIGGGPGGYVAAMRAALRGAKVVLVEKDKLGGTCLNRGCIPTKALLQSAQTLNICKKAENFGVITAQPAFDAAKVNARKQSVVDGLVNGVRSLLAARKVEVIAGAASLVSAHEVKVATDSGEEKKLSAKNIVLATGSVPTMPPIPGLNAPGVITSNEALNITQIPESMVIIGGGVIGMEIGSVYADFGCKVTVIEAMPEILPNMDGEVAKTYHRLAGKKMDIRTGRKVIRVEDCGAGKRVVCSNGDKEESAEAALVFVAIGRRPYLDGLGLDAVGVKTERGHVAVDDKWCTSVPNIYCIGDANGRLMLAHAASAQAIEVADLVTGHGQTPGNKHDVIPSCIYTHPEIACVGKTEEQLKAEGAAYTASKFPVRANGRSLVLDEPDGFVKILADANGAVLGVHIVGPYATELIGECALAMRLECTLEELADTVHAHPTVSESIMEAAEAGLIGAIHCL